MSAEKTNAEDSKDRQDYDTPWKKVLETYFKEFVHFFFPDMAEDIDWSRGYEFLDKELQQVAKDAELGRRYADSLASVFRKSGREEWVMIHAEIQGQDQYGFSKRMYTYNYRTFDRFDRKVASLAILADNNPSWRPDSYSYELWGSKVGLWFRTVKLLDYKERWDWLEQSTNPFAAVVMAHLKATETADDPRNRYRWKLFLVKRLYRMGYDRRDVILLFEFIDWVMTLPKHLEDGLWNEIDKMEKERKMAYITSVQRIGREEGREEGLQEEALNFLGRLVSKRFKLSREEVRPIFEGLATEQLEELGEFFVDAQSLDEIRERADRLRKQS